MYSRLIDYWRVMMIDKLMNADPNKLFKWGFRLWIGAVIVALCGAGTVVYVAAHFIAKAW